MTDDIEVHLRLDDLTGIDLDGQNSFLVQQGSGNGLAEW